jgi:Flp pilus assembly protein TadG
MSRTPLAEAGHEKERGQALVVFVIAMTVIIGVVGLVLDGGDAFAQRRSEQNAADFAALAAANNYMVTGDGSSSSTAARTSAASNGYTDGTGSVSVNMGYDFSQGTKVTVTINAQHHNNFLGLIGQATWSISASATALAGLPDTAYGAGPFIFSIDVFDSNGSPRSQYANSTNPYDFGDGNGDVPNDAGDIAWTNYGTGNVNTSEVAAIIAGDTVINKQLTFGQYIGQHNDGNHTALFSEVDEYLSGTDTVVPVVDHNGNFQGWSTFHIVSAAGGSSKTITGYFLSSFSGDDVGVGCANGTCPRYLGTYVLKLTN